MTGGALGVLAGGGALPRMIAEAAAGAGRKVCVVAFDGHTAPETPAGFPCLWTRFGAAGGAVEWLRGQGVDELVFAGPVKRPSLADIKPDWWTAKFLAKIGVKAFGDDGLLRAISATLEAEGFRIVGMHQVLDGLLTPAGQAGRHAPDEQALRDIDLGVRVARGLGALDVGQACVVQQGLVLAVEAIEGTDAMLARCGGLARQGTGGVLVKMRKPQQDQRLDLPTIGVATIENAAAAGLRGVAVEAGGSLIVDRPAVASTADRLGLFVIGVAPAEDAP
jgi:UDP-2,3-diacylglucosamine hydrolase